MIAPLSVPVGHNLPDSQTGHLIWRPTMRETLPVVGYRSVLEHSGQICGQKL